MKQLTTTLTLTTLLLAGLGVAAAGPRHGGGHRGGPGMDGFGPGAHLMRGLERLDLSEEQRAEARALLVQAKPEMAALREQLRQNRLAFRESHPPTTFDEAEVRAHAAEQAGIMTELAVRGAELRARVLALLTPEQLAELEQMREQARERRGMRKGHGRR